jgi:hypothetical protein
MQVIARNIFQGAETLRSKEPDLNDLTNPWGSKYTESMCLEMIEMFSKGKTRAQFCAKHTISNDTFETWKKRHPLFARAYEIAHQQARSFYDALRQDYLVQEFEGDSINWGLFNRMYNTRFNIPDKRLITVKALGKAKDERAMLKSIMNAVANGELTPDEAQKLAMLIDVSLKINHTQELEDRVKALEGAQISGFNDDDFEEVPDV